ncbi:MAG TPA: hypothetical protein VFS57_06500, partial [Gemmatimonadaceae bacterium]|nr:hypothetical protein [Gemmatimonadaceae bacterium]
MSSDRSYLVLVAALLVAIAGATVVRGTAPKFRSDDPIQVDDDRALDASKAAPIDGSNMYDFAEETFFKPGDRRNVHAMNVNTLDEVPDSTWFTNRIGGRAIPIDELVRGPNYLDGLDISGWPIVEGKSRGVTPGYRIVDPTGRLYQVKFDPPSNPEMASGAEVIGAAIYHALGYNVVEGYIAEVDPSAIVIAPTATTVDMKGRRKLMTRADVDKVLKRAARQPNGKYRAIVSRYAAGKPLGYFKYYGTRPDDPNDIHPHEHRRELRGSRVFAAWLNHDDSRGINSLDMLETSDGRGFIRHYMFDFGSIMGSGSTMPQAPRAGNEYILEWKPGWITLATLGLWVRPWALVRYPDVAKSVGRFEADFFDPVKWKPEYPNPAFDNMRADDAFWAARLVSKFSDEAIRAIVAKARYSEPGASEYITKILIARRDKVLATWLTAVNPIGDVSLAADGALTFHNAAADAGLARGAVSYELTWMNVDNATGTTTPASEPARIDGLRATLPAPLARGGE